MLHKICHDAWVHEVVAKKKEHSVGWVLSVSKEMNFVEQDKKTSNQTKREEVDEEPVTNSLFFTCYLGCSEKGLPRDVFCASQI